MRRHVAFVTGAASGIGRAIAQRLASDGAAVAIADVDADAGAQVAGAIESAGGEACFVHCDVVQRDAIDAATHAVVEQFGGIDMLVNNAGFENPAFFLQSDPESWQDLIAVNLIGVLNCTYVVAPVIFERARQTGYGRIVNIASDAGRSGALGESVYSAAKGGVIAFSKSTAREFARERVTVNAVCPGPVETPMTDMLRATEVGAKMLDRIAGVTPLRRLATADEVAAQVAYFTSEDAGFATGQVLSVSGGLSMQG